MEEFTRDELELLADLLAMTAPRPLSENGRVIWSEAADKVDRLLAELALHDKPALSFRALVAGGMFVLGAILGLLTGHFA